MIRVPPRTNDWIPAALAVLAATLLCSCVARPLEKPTTVLEREIKPFFPQSLEKDIDILFVIDNSDSMRQEQENLSRNFPKFIEALRSPKLGNSIPNVHIGIVSTDLGAGSYSVPGCEVPGGDGGRLQVRASCPVLPSRPYISYIDGKTNIGSGPADPIAKVRSAFSCMAELGDDGCGFEQPLQAARRALDATRNPGFLRRDAFLAVVFITDEDDCSAALPQLFDPAQTQLDDPLGPLHSFRCFEFGVQCDCPGGDCRRTRVGPRRNCKPAGNHLHGIEDYVSYFKGLKPPGRVLMFAISGPTDRVEVGMNGSQPVLRPSCTTSMGKAKPPIRLRKLIESFGDKGYFNQGTDATLTQKLPVNICSTDYGPALRMLGKVIVADLGGQCFRSPLLTMGGGLACQAGDVLGPDGEVCQASCLDQAECRVELIEDMGLGASRPVPRCPSELFDPGLDQDRCGSSCPCWRIVPNPACKPEVDGSPYGFQIMRRGEPRKGQVARVTCAASPEMWGTSEFAALPQCQ